MKKIIYSIIALIIYITPSFSETISLIINGNVITKTNIDNMAKILLIDAKIPVTNENINKFNTVAKNEFVNKYLKGRIATRNGIEISDVMLDRYVKRLASEQGKTIDEYYIPYYRHGIEPKLLFEKLRIDVLWQVYVDEILVNRLAFNQDDLDKYIANITNKKMRNVSIISIPIIKGKNDSASAIKQIATNIKVDNFATMAKYYSVDYSAFNGGNIGWVKKNDQPRKIDNIIWGIPVNTVSNVIKVNNNYVIIKVNKQKIETGKDKERLKQEYLNQVIQKNISSQIEYERNRLEIEYK
ncbi:MAG: peptidylprolyl isomerase [Alphaproteobacteria bacterium]